LFKPFDQQFRLWLDQQANLQLLGQFDTRHQLVVKNVGRGTGGLLGRNQSARLGGDVRCAQVVGQLERSLGMFAPDRSIVRVRIGPAGMPIGLPRIAHGVHHKGVDVGDRQVMLVQLAANRFTTFWQQPGRPGVWHIGQQLDARIANRRNPANGLLDRVLHIGVGTEGELHEDAAGGWIYRVPNHSTSSAL